MERISVEKWLIRRYAQVRRRGDREDIVTSYKVKFQQDLEKLRQEIKDPEEFERHKRSLEARLRGSLSIFNTRHLPPIEQYARLNVIYFAEDYLAINGAPRVLGTYQLSEHPSKRAEKTLATAFKILEADYKYWQEAKTIFKKAKELLNTIQDSNMVEMKMSVKPETAHHEEIVRDLFPKLRVLESSLQEYTRDVFSEFGFFMPLPAEVGGETVAKWIVDVDEFLEQTKLSYSNASKLVLRLLQDHSPLIMHTVVKDLQNSFSKRAIGDTLCLRRLVRTETGGDEGVE